MPTVPSNAFQFYNTTVDGLNLVTRGLAFEWGGQSASGFGTVYITAVGLNTDGLVLGLGDFWEYAPAAEALSWNNEDTGAETITWTVVS